jgi:hypothetical protein
MHNVNKYVLYFSMVMILLLSISSVSAENMGDSVSIVDEASPVSTIDGDSYINDQDTLESSLIEDSNGIGPSSFDSPVSMDSEDAVLGSSSNRLLIYNNNGSDDVVNNTYSVDSANFNTFFDNKVLKSEYANATLFFEGSFDNLGILKLYSNDTVITARNSSFYNTVFDLGASGIVLSNINMVLDKGFSNNGNAGIFVHADNVTVYNCTINYNSSMVKAFGI